MEVSPSTGLTIEQNMYGNNQDCGWTLSLPQGYMVSQRPLCFFRCIGSKEMGSMVAFLLVKTYLDLSEYNRTQRQKLRNILTSYHGRK